ncbi:Phosphatidylinositol N-acetylglucosaminyltransferase subunit P [Leucoagaricus sp. SymC.cos]|nr:Phosphatidylinositol N-acetylglucosaminyltransferase subunit P [Leucoagaricus sp. SymC.cos]KXN86525.1 Phosphatidylinositol N-acetylglucosaminyltransferase subunit P [Leucoagaricus sp. SymC.cos]
MPKAQNSSSRPTSRAPEFYGFVAWASTSVLFVVYILWALLPDEWIVAMGVEWYPNREWSILIPAWSIIVIILTYIVYWSLALLGTPSFSDLSTMTDSFVQLPPSGQSPNAYIVSADSSAIPHLYDIPIGMVNRVLYHRKTTDKD